ncbi:PfkB family carbohydrate kinase [Hymenobacter humi]|uniref:PfkB family carbohydrate kinase n=1 Tax=Hymenobacter humi TaxID=1411620 RepID=A0ABW2U2R1_9BACT
MEWFGKKADEDSALEWLASRFNLQAVCVTLGADGALLYTNGQLYKSNGYHVEVTDTIGSGDAFLAALLAGWLAGQPPQECLQFACAAGALVATHQGATPVITPPMWPGCGRLNRYPPNRNSSSSAATSLLMKKPFLLACSVLALAFASHAQTAAPVPPATPQYRPAYHFTPAAHWMNDPNGMVYYQGTYHLFFQYYPDGMVWGPMHWGHATSTDLVRWKEQPIALYPDKLGMIFSGSAVIDKDNTAGFGKDAMVAIFTHHSPEEEKKGQNKHQYQSLAYSLDAGKTWKKYEGNPVLPNPGIADFRDPKVSWYEAGKKWVMTLATKDRITFYSSPNLKNWTKESEFGAKLGAHGGVWECPDLFPMTLNGKTHWVLIVNLNPGGPNGGSGTQYFVGNFDGKTFTPAAPIPNGLITAPMTTPA